MAEGATPTEAPRICLSAVSGGGGKTLLCLGLAGALRRAGHVVAPFKKGPDYIDAAWLSLAAGRRATNLDPWFLPPERLRSLFLHSLKRAGPGSFALLEGNRGLYDGLDSRGSCSTAVLARILDCPVVVSLDCTKATRTVAAVLAGLAAFEPETRIVGAILNRLGSSRQESLIRRAVEEHTDLRVFGALPRLDANPLPERHMGLASLAGDGISPERERILEELATLAADHVDLDALVAAGRAAPPLPPAPDFWPEAPDPAEPRPVIAYVRDAALWFYYEENLEALERAGARLSRISLLDAASWPRMDGLYLGGGFPEDWAAHLAKAHKTAELACLAKSGMPVYAECGGFMVLAKALEREGVRHGMAGVFPVTAQFRERPQGLGYVEAEVMEENPWLPKGSTVRGHEFHFSRCIAEEGTEAKAVLRLNRGTGMAPFLPGWDGLLRGRTMASYMHVFAPATPGWAEGFVAAARAFAEERDGVPCG